MTTSRFRLPASPARRYRARRTISQQAPSLLARRIAVDAALDAADAELIALLPQLGIPLSGLPVGRECTAAGDDTIAASSGWFESTWELARGLDVAEGLPADLPVDAWLQFDAAR